MAYVIVIILYYLWVLSIISRVLQMITTSEKYWTFNMKTRFGPLLLLLLFHRKIRRNLTVAYTYTRYITIPRAFAIIVILSSVSRGLRYPTYSIVLGTNII